MSSSNNDDNFIIKKLKDVINDQKLQDKIKEKANNKLMNIHNKSEQHKQFCKEKNIDIINAENFYNKRDTAIAISTVANSINEKISNLKPNETKKILIDCDDGVHMIGIVIGKTKDNKSYIFLDRENESGRYLGGNEKDNGLSGVFFEKLKVDRIIPIPRIQSDYKCCYVYSYLLLEVFTSKDIKVQNLIDKAFNKSDKIYRGDGKTQNTNGQNIVDIKELPLLMQILYQRENSVLQERLEENLVKEIVKINKTLLEDIKFDVLTKDDIQKLQEDTQKCLGNLHFNKNEFDDNMKRIMEKRATTNHILPFLTTIAYVDMDKFIEITNDLCRNKTEKQISKQDNKNNQIEKMTNPMLRTLIKKIKNNNTNVLNKKEDKNKIKNLVRTRQEKAKQIKAQIEKMEKKINNIKNGENVKYKSKYFNPTFEQELLKKKKKKLNNQLTKIQKLINANNKSIPTNNK